MLDVSSMSIEELKEHIKNIRARRKQYSAEKKVRKTRTKKESLLEGIDPDELQQLLAIMNEKKKKGE